MLLNTKSSLSDLIKNNKNINICNDNIVKANVDIKKEIVYIGEVVHADMEAEMLNSGSQRGDLAGINIFIDELIPGELLNKSIIEFSSIINFDINKMTIGDFRSGYLINDINTQNKIMEILSLWLVQ